MKLWKSLLATVLTVLMVMTMSVYAFAYTDVSEEDEYLSYITVVDSLGLMPANTMGDFNPNGYYSRGEALVTAYRMLNAGDNGIEDYKMGGQLFEDVDSDNSYYPYINWAYDNGLITNDLDEQKFEPAEPISAPEFLTLFVKVGGIEIGASSSAGEDGEEGAEVSASGDGEGSTTQTEFTYPNSYVDAAYDFIGNISGDEEKLTRNLAAMTLAQLLWYQDSDTNIDLSSLEDEYGNRLNCFATKVYGLNKIILTIRATSNRTMGYSFDGDVLLSNGCVLKTDEDISKYIGHPIEITFRDMDQSNTLTEDEEIISYSVNSLMILSPELSDITFTDYTTFGVTSIGLSFNITNATKFYYNDEPWSEDAQLNLINIAGGVGTARTITNRPNMVFTVVPSEIADTDSGIVMILEAFVEEHRPAKIVSVVDGKYTLYDYYARGTNEEYRQFTTDQIKFETSSTSVGDYVNYYTSNGVCHILDGSAIKTQITSINSGNSLTLKDGTIITPHYQFQRANTIPELNTDVVIITEDVNGTFYLGWEYPSGAEKTPAFVQNYSENMNGVTYNIFDCVTGEDAVIEVLTDNIMATSAIEEGEFIYVSKDVQGNYIVERAKKSDKVKLGVETEEYFVESSTGKIYNKSPYYYGNLYTDTFKEDYYKMILDISGNVLALE